MDKSRVELKDSVKFWKSAPLGIFVKRLYFKFKGYLNFSKSFFILNKLFLLLTWFTTQWIIPLRRSLFYDTTTFKPNYNHTI